MNTLEVSAHTSIIKQAAIKYISASKISLIKALGEPSVCLVSQGHRVIIWAFINQNKIILIKNENPELPSSNEEFWPTYCQNITLKNLTKFFKKYNLNNISDRQPSFL